MSDPEIADLVCGGSAGDSDEGEEGQPQGSRSGDDDECASDGPLLQCVGCGALSNSKCPIAWKARKERVTIPWAKTTNKKVRERRTGVKKKKKIKCGEWCRLCQNIARQKVTRGKYRKAEKKKKGSGIKLLKCDLRDGGETKRRWKAAHREAVNLRAGGRSRINEYKEDVQQNEEIMEEVTGPKRQFWLLKEYRDEFGDPKTNKAKVTERFVVDDKGRKRKQKGVYVITGRKGVYDVASSLRNSVQRRKLRHSGKEVLEQDEMQEAFDSAAEEQADEFDTAGALTLEETERRAAAAEEAEAAAQGSGDDAQGSDDAGDDSDSDSSSSSDDDDSDKPDKDKDSDGSDSDDKDSASACSDKRKRKRAKSESEVATPTPKKSPGEEQRGVQRRLCHKQPASAAPSPSLSRKQRDEITLAIDTLSKRLASFKGGELDAVRGRQAQRVLKEWGTDVLHGKKLLRIMPAEQKPVMNELTVNLDRVIAFVRCFSKATVNVTDLEKAYADLVAVHVSPSSTATKIVLCKQVEALVDARKFDDAVDTFMKFPIPELAVRERTISDHTLTILKAMLPPAKLQDEQVREELNQQVCDYFQKMDISRWPLDQQQELRALQKLTASAGAGDDSGDRALLDMCVETQKGKERKGLLAVFVASPLGKQKVKALGVAIEDSAKEAIKAKQFDDSMVNLAEAASMSDVQKAMTSALTALAALVDSVTPTRKQFVQERLDVIRGHVKICVVNVLELWAGKLQVQVSEEEMDSAQHTISAKPEDLLQFCDIMKKAVGFWEYWNKCERTIEDSPGRETPWMLDSLFEAHQLLIDTLEGQRFSLSDNKYKDHTTQMKISFAKKAHEVLENWSDVSGWEVELQPVMSEHVATAVGNSVAYVKQQVRAAVDMVASHLDTLFSPESAKDLAISVEVMRTAWSPDDGDLVVGDSITAVLARDRAKEITRLDALAGVATVLAHVSAASANFWKQKQIELEVLSLAFPGFQSACECKVNLQKFPRLEQITADRALDLYLTAFAALATETSALEKSEKAVEIAAALRKFLQLQVNALDKMLEGCVTDCKGNVKVLKDGIAGVDLKAIEKQWDAEYHKLCEVQNYEGLVETLKLLNGSAGKGLKLFDKLRSALSGFRTTLSTGETHETVRKLVTDARQSARQVEELGPPAAASSGQQQWQWQQQRQQQRRQQKQKRQRRRW